MGLEVGRVAAVTTNRADLLGQAGALGPGRLDPCPKGPGLVVERLDFAQPLDRAPARHGCPHDVRIGPDEAQVEHRLLTQCVFQGADHGFVVIPECERPPQASDLEHPS